MLSLQCSAVQYVTPPEAAALKQCLTANLVQHSCLLHTVILCLPRSDLCTVVTHHCKVTFVMLPSNTPLVPPHVQVVKGLAGAVGVMQAALPVLQALHNPAIRERHWTKLAAIMATPVVTEPPLTLSQLLNLKVYYVAL